MGILQLPYMDTSLYYVLKVLRVLSCTPLAASLRQDWLAIYLSNHMTFLTTTLALYMILIGFLHQRYGTDDVTADVTNNNNSDWWNFNWDGYMTQVLRPMATLTRPMSPQDMDLEVGMELLIERLAVPNLWLHPIISSDYMKELPVWRYTGGCPPRGSLPGSDSEWCLSDTECTKSDGEEPSTSNPSCSLLDGGQAQRSLSMDSIRPGWLPELFTCEACRALRAEQENRNKSPAELEAERQENVSACAKFLMDGDYQCPCMCHKAGGSGGPPGGSPKRAKHSSRHLTRGSPARLRARSLSPEHIGAMNSRDLPVAGGSGHSVHCREMGHSVQCPGGQGEYGLIQDSQEDLEASHWPPGILPTSECVICLETYRHGVTLCGLPCSHCFHHKCIMGWLSRDNHCCPVCRWPTYKAKPCNKHLHSQ